MKLSELSDQELRALQNGAAREELDRREERRRQEEKERREAEIQQSRREWIQSLPQGELEILADDPRTSHNPGRKWGKVRIPWVSLDLSKDEVVNMAREEIERRQEPIQQAAPVREGIPPVALILAGIVLFAVLSGGGG